MCFNRFVTHSQEIYGEKLNEYNQTKKSSFPKCNKKATAEFTALKIQLEEELLIAAAGYSSYYWPCNKGSLSPVLALPKGIPAILSEKCHCFLG